MFLLYSFVGLLFTNFCLLENAKSLLPGLIICASRKYIYRCVLRVVLRQNLDVPYKPPTMGIGGESKLKKSVKKSNWQLLLKSGSTSTKSIDGGAKKRSSAVDSEKVGETDKKHKVAALERGEGRRNNLPGAVMYVGLDCEMVGLGPSGKQSALARACLVDYDGNVIYDRYVRPKGYVTDFRTKYSGVRSGNLRKGEACTFEECQEEVASLLKGKFLVGHALKNDLAVLMLSHPRAYIRDTACYRPLMKVRKVGVKERYRPNALRNLAKEKLGITIQDGEHDPGVDARTAMMVYRDSRDEWEHSLAEASKVIHEKHSMNQKKQEMERENRTSDEFTKKKNKSAARPMSVFAALEDSGGGLRGVDDVDEAS
jgi:RNA exonuclease 4